MILQHKKRSLSMWECDYHLFPSQYFSFRPEVAVAFLMRLCWYWHSFDNILQLILACDDGHVFKTRRRWVVTKPSHSVFLYILGLSVIVDQDYINPSNALLICSGPEEDWGIQGFFTQYSTNQKARISGLQSSTSYQVTSIHPFILCWLNLTSVTFHN